MFFFALKFDYCLQMFLYNLTLQKASGITHAVHGNFSGSRSQELVVSRGRSLELLRPDPNTGKVRILNITAVRITIQQAQLGKYNLLSIQAR